MSDTPETVYREISSEARQKYILRHQAKGLENPRTQAMISMRETGLTQDEVGEVFGVSRQRVSQILAGVGYGTPDAFVDVVGVLQAVREVKSMCGLYERLARREKNTRRLLDALGMTPAVTRYWKWKRGYLRRQRRSDTAARHIANLQSLASELGHTPSQRELESAGLNHMIYVKYFGSMGNAAIAAGLPRRSVGGAGHLSKIPQRMPWEGPS